MPAAVVAPALGGIGGAAFGGWAAIAEGQVARTGSDGVSRALVGIVLAMLAGGGAVLIAVMHNPLRHPRHRLTAAFPQRGLDEVGIWVGPWPAAGGQPQEDAVVVLLSGGPAPVEVDGGVRWMRNGEALRLGPVHGHARARPLRGDGVWIRMRPEAAPREDPAALR